MNHWLMKSEPDVFGIEDLEKRPKKTEHWDGVRNYQARNFIRDQMRRGDQAFFYHSNCPEPGIVGIIEIVREAYPDFTAWDRTSRYYHPKSTPERPIWYMVDIRFVGRFGQPVTLAEIRKQPTLWNMPLVQRGNRLSIMPVTASEWQTILRLAKA